MGPQRTKSCSVSFPVSTENHDSLGLVFLDKGFSKVPEEPIQGTTFAHGDVRDVHLQQRGCMGEEECRDLLRRRREIIECFEPLVSGFWSGHSHGCGGLGGDRSERTTVGSKKGGASTFIHEEALVGINPRVRHVDNR